LDEIRYGDNASASVINAMQRWLATGGAQLATVRYSLFGFATVLRVDFEKETEASAFAQAFGGVVLPNRQKPTAPTPHLARSLTGDSIRSLGASNPPSTNPKRNHRRALSGSAATDLEDSSAPVLCLSLLTGRARIRY
jgi:hypothetical protein